jgi:KipI family sensor histidine kinase inhibitor
VTPLEPGPATIRPFGDSAFLVVLGDRVDEGLNLQVHRLARELAERCRVADGWAAPVPAYASLLLAYDAEQLDASDAEHQLRTAMVAATTGVAPTTRLSGPNAGLAGPDRPDVHGSEPLEIPVRYGGREGPDLEQVAASLGLSPQEVVHRHAARTYRVFVLGFAPGFAYLGPLPSELRLPRRAQVRSRVPAGSVAIVGEQTAVYPFETPGGWHILGRTELSLWDPAGDPPARLRPGGRVRFAPVD